MKKYGIEVIVVYFGYVKIEFILGMEKFFFVIFVDKVVKVIVSGIFKYYSNIIVLVMFWVVLGKVMLMFLDKIVEKVF